MPTRLDASDFRKVALEAKVFDAALRRSLVKNVRAAAQLGASAAKEGAREIPAGKADRGLRQKLANSVTVQVRSTGKRAGASIISSPSKGGLADNERNLPRRMDGIGKWRHPLFGNRNYWYDQPAHPWFRHKIQERREEMALLMRAALVEAANEATGSRFGFLRTTGHF